MVQIVQASFNCCPDTAKETCNRNQASCLCDHQNGYKTQRRARTLIPDSVLITVLDSRTKFGSVHTFNGVWLMFVNIAKRELNAHCCCSKSRDTVTVKGQEELLLHCSLRPYVLPLSNNPRVLTEAADRLKFLLAET